MTTECTKANDKSGIKCREKDTTFYICTNNKNDDGFKSFVGCCKAKPDFNDKTEHGCSPDDLRDATYTNATPTQLPSNCVSREWQRNPQFQDCALQDSSNGATSRYIGCCEASCNEITSVCPPEKKAWARFTSKDDLYRFVEAYGDPWPASSGASSSSTLYASGTPTTSPGGTPEDATPSSVDKADDSRLPNGSVAGIAIGCMAAGLLLGGLVAMLFFRRRKQRRSPQPEHVQVPYAPGKERDHLSQSMSAGGVDDDVQLGQFLLSPNPDNEIASGLQSLNALIRQHVENNYHLQPVRQTSKSLAQALHALGLSDRQGQGQGSPDDISRLVLDARTRPAALQHVITRVALQSSTLSVGSGKAPVSMLPPSVAMFAQSVPATERHRGNAEAVSIAMTRWRQLSAFLLHPHRSERTPLPLLSEEGNGVVAQQAQQLARELNRFLDAFVAPRGREQEAHLRQVLVECAQFGYLLFSQRAEYRFDYEGRQGGGGVVVCPGLERVSDVEGRRLSKPHVLAAPVEDV